jgi:8-oxo-dGTP pyrophosphatase MutT (NUDIX family)
MKTTCGIAIISPDKKILAAHPTRHAYNQWDLIKGVIDENESPLQTIHREFLEETGLTLSSICNNIIDFSTYFHIQYTYKHKQKKLHAFIGFLDKHIDITYFKCNSMVTGFLDLPPFPEIDAFTWIDFADIDLLHESQQRFLLDVKGRYSAFDDVNMLKAEKSHQYG